MILIKTPGNVPNSSENAGDGYQLLRKKIRMMKHTFAWTPQLIREEKIFLFFLLTFGYSFCLLHESLKPPEVCVMKSKIRQENFRPFDFVLRNAHGIPRWILKWGGLESSGRRLTSSFGKTKRIAFFFFGEKKIFSNFQIFWDLSRFSDFLTIFENFLIFGVF